MDDQATPQSLPDDKLNTEASRASKKRAIKQGESSVQNQQLHPAKQDYQQRFADVNLDLTRKTAQSMRSAAKVAR